MAADAVKRPRAPKLTDEAVADLRANVVTGSRWERYTDGRRVIVHDVGLWRDLVRIKTVLNEEEFLASKRRTFRTAWTNISRSDLVRQYQQTS